MVGFLEVCFSKAVSKSLPLIPTQVNELSWAIGGYSLGCCPPSTHVIESQEVSFARFVCHSFMAVNVMLLLEAAKNSLAKCSRAVVRHLFTDWLADIESLEGWHI